MPQHAGADAAEPESARPAQKARVLVVDDSRVIRRVIVRVLGPEFDLVEREDGEAGWETLLQDPSIGAVFTDVEMPNLDGYGLLARIRQSGDTRVQQTPVIIITGADDEASRARAYKAGANDFITKPIDAVQLLARAHTHVRLDTTARKLVATEAALEEQATRDPATGVYNRRFLLQRGHQDFAFARRHHSGLSLICLEPDGFKDLFARYGDDVADRVLLHTARTLEERTREEEIVARIGGTEFAVLAPATDRNAALVLAERLRTAVTDSPFREGRMHIPLSASVGLAVIDDEQAGIEALLAQARKCLEQARLSGGNCTKSAESAKRRPEPTPVATPAPPLEAALDMIVRKDTAALEPHLAALAQQVLPLLELANKQLGLSLGFALDSLRSKLSQHE